MSSLIPTPYQLIHLMKLRSNGYNCLLIADGVGVGKTISAGYVIFHQSVISRRPVLVVCPPILADKWIAEMKTKFHLHTRRATNAETFDLMIDEISSKEDWDTGPVYVTTYSVLSRKENLVPPSFGLVVMDEIHAARNPKTRLYPVLKEICMNSDYRVGLSATPINNSTSDLASIQSLLMPKYDFEELNSLLEDLWGLPVSESMSCITTRFTKDMVASHFTKRNILNVEVEYSSEYTAFVNQIITEMYPGLDGIQLQTITMHRIAASSPSAFMRSIGERAEKSIDDPKIAKLQEIIESKPEERFLVFTEFKETAEYISRSIPGRLVLQTSGDSNLEQREANSFLFRETDASIMIMTPVGSEGLDFQFCSNLVNYDLHWNPMKIEQRIGRIDRIGQKKDTVSIYNFHVVGSIDERVRDVMGDKLRLVSGSFADVSSIIETNDSLSKSEMSLLAIEKETKSARALIRSSNFYNQISSSDHHASTLVRPENCNFHNWIYSEWNNSFPWSDEVTEWQEALTSESAKFSNLLSSYQIPEA